MPRWVPAVTVRALLEGFRQLGLDERRLLANAAVPDEALSGASLVPDAVRRRLWASACRAAQRDSLAIEAGLALPFGALGPMDYLAGAADTLGACCDALSQQFHSVSWERRVEIDERPGDYRVKLVVQEMRDDTLRGDEFTLGVMVGRFRARVEGFSLAAVQLRGAPPKHPERLAEVLGAPVSFGHAAAAICLPGRARGLPISSRDPWLTRALESLLPDGGRDTQATALVRSLRQRLRQLLPEGPVTASALADTLGMSERSLHRRLRELGQSYRGVVDVFRREEAERLLLEGQLEMSHIALHLGFSDQTAFSRAFKRWTRMAPRDWLARRPSLASGERARSLAASVK